jgi:hypothetical protein
MQVSVKFSAFFREIEKIALNHSILPARFQRNGVSCSDQLKFFQARVAIIDYIGLIDPGHVQENKGNTSWKLAVLSGLLCAWFSWWHVVRDWH